MNLQQLTAIAGNLAGDNQLQRYANLYTQALNLAQQQFSMESKCLFQDSNITVVGGTAAYSLPTDFIWEKKVTYKNVRLAPLSRQSLEVVRSDDWTTDQGDPRFYIVDPEQARKTITLYPFPPAGDAGGALVLTYFFLPTDLVNNSDVPFDAYDLLTPYHIALPPWAAWYLLQAENPSDGIAAQALQMKKKDLLQIYNDQVSLATERFQNTVSEPWRMRGVRNVF